MARFDGILDSLHGEVLAELDTPRHSITGSRHAQTTLTPGRKTRSTVTMKAISVSPPGAS